jgi:hypothetical protein
VHCTKLNIEVQLVLAHLLQTPIMGVSSLNLGRAFCARPFFWLSEGFGVLRGAERPSKSRSGLKVDPALRYLAHQKITEHVDTLRLPHFFWIDEIDLSFWTFNVAQHVDQFIG